MKIVLATTNLHKIRELKEMLKSMKDLDILTLSQFPNYTPAEETGKTFEEIAIQKAVDAAKVLDSLVLAEDSGIIAYAINGPGVRSKRYAGENATDSENRKKLLKELSSFSGDERGGAMTCAMALANPKGLIKCVTGTCEGTIANEERGRSGFGYDSLFCKLEYGDKTFAELDESTKNRISHRRKAFEKMLITLQSQ